MIGLVGVLETGLLDVFFLYKSCGGQYGDDYCLKKRCIIFNAMIFIQSQRQGKDRIQSIYCTIFLCFFGCFIIELSLNIQAIDNIKVKYFMSLGSNFRILPYQITCDMAIFCYNPYFDIQFKQYYSLNDLSKAVQSVSSAYKIVIMSNSFEEGEQIITKISQINDQKNSQRTQIEEDVAEVAIDNRLMALGQRLIKAVSEKSSMLHLKCMLNATESKINTLSKEINQRSYEIQKQANKRVEKKVKKQQKIKQKQLQKLQDNKKVLQLQIQSQEDKKWWKQQFNKYVEQEQEQQDENLQYLLSDQEQKENIVGM